MYTRLREQTGWLEWGERSGKEDARLDAPTCKEVTLSRSITPKNDIVSWRKWLEVDLVAVWPVKYALV